MEVKVKVNVSARFYSYGYVQEDVLPQAQVQSAAVPARSDHLCELFSKYKLSAASFTETGVVQGPTRGACARA